MLDSYEFEIKSLTLVPSLGGRFEVSANQQLIFSKLKTTRHPLPGEVMELLETWMKEDS